MTATASLADLEWLRDQLPLLDATDGDLVERMREWVETAIRVRQAQKTRSKTKAHADLMEAYEAARQRWRLLCEQETNAFPSEVAEFRLTHPMPTFKAFLTSSRRPTLSDVCPLCGTPLNQTGAIFAGQRGEAHAA